MQNLRFYRIAIAFCLGLLVFSFHFSVGQDIPAAPAAEGPIDRFKITVNVSEVRLDVVVLDGKGEPITDLTADDFEIHQDKQLQEVTSSVYISDQTKASAWPGASQKDRAVIQTAHETALKKEEIRRNILFVVDNLSMSVQDMYNAKMTLKGFVEKQMQPGDMVSIMCTGYGNSAIDMFYSDKRPLLARIDGLHVELAMPDRIYGSQMLTMSYGIRALKDMPGRKNLFLLTSEYTIKSPKPTILDMPEPINYYELYVTADLTADAPLEPEVPNTPPAPVNVGDQMPEQANNYDMDMYDNPYSRLADEALRAGVVIHLLETRGLEYYEPSVSLDIFPEEIRSLVSNSLNPDYPVSQKFERAQSDNYSFLNPLPAKTGGLLVRNNNFFPDGIGQEANNMIAGYYLVSYTPPADTFDRNVFHPVTVRVKRKGAVVHTREGFYGVTGNENNSETEHPLKTAVFSPFQHPDLNVNVAAGYIKDTEAGYIIRAWIHLDAKDVKMVETGKGATINLETVCLTTGINAATDQDLRHIRYSFDIESGKIALVQKYGLRFSLLLPVKKPGYYTVRAAVEDMESGRIGTAYQFVEIPDLKKKGLALSDIFMITGDDDLGWMRSDVIKEINEGVFFPEISSDETWSPALRTYAPGDNLQTLMMIYNADAKAIAGSEIETQSILYKDGVVFLRNESRPVAAKSVDKLAGIPILQKLTLGKNMPPGRYTLQLRVTDKKSREKKPDENGPASQILNFTVKGNAD